jgi:hypothetical protein
MNSEASFFVTDSAGINHYSTAVGRDIWYAVKEALESRPLGPSWFWHNGTPAPILTEDTPDTLYSRWREWRSTYQSDPKKFLALVANFAGID